MSNVFYRKIGIFRNIGEVELAKLRDRAKAQVLYSETGVPAVKKGLRPDLKDKRIGRIEFQNVCAQCVSVERDAMGSITLGFRPVGRKGEVLRDFIHMHGVDSIGFVPRLQKGTDGRINVITFDAVMA